MAVAAHRCFTPATGDASSLSYRNLPPPPLAASRQPPSTR